MTAGRCIEANATNRSNLLPLFAITLLALSACGGSDGEDHFNQSDLEVDSSKTSDSCSKSGSSYYLMLKGAVFNEYFPGTRGAE
jgi:hypothetical protein